MSETVPRLSHSSLTLTLARVLAVLGWTAVLIQLYLSVDTEIRAGKGAAFGVLMYTGYFTLLSNIFCATVATGWALYASGKDRYAVWQQPWVISAATLSIVMVGVIYLVVLSDQYDPQGINFWVNTTLHYVVPPLFAMFWWLAVPRGTLVVADVARMLAYPVAYLVYLIVRGEATGLYPYFFVDVPRIGYVNALINAGVISGVFALTAGILVALKRR